ncbi:hypothetical protein B0J15DRAFT_581090 [Fusarium solani]|uniref:Uncharacterized protein n=1 Tax=Fusarium solani TaxID=169388 RepID=A0A9P9HU94_FUSSL|nr:uncharacterized protein B0J15DRAFT_581090 [Fusarium solani]KAH7264138.1 hypothetical protein B0J15DRAFT_581090 [Fusarium solani]
MARGLDGGQGFIGKHHERSHRGTTHTVDSACAPSEGNTTEKSKAGAPSSSNVKDAMPRAMRGFFTLDPSGKETAGGQDGSHGPVNHTNVGLAIERLLRRWTGVWRAQGVGCSARRDWPGPVASARFKRRACSPNLDCALSSSCITPTTPRPMRGTGWRKKKRPNSVRGSDAAERIHEGLTSHVVPVLCCAEPSPSPVQVRYSSRTRAVPLQLQTRSRSVPASAHVGTEKRW